MTTNDVHPGGFRYFSLLGKDQHTERDRRRDGAQGVVRPESLFH